MYAYACLPKNKIITNYTDDKPMYAYACLPKNKIITNYTDDKSMYACRKNTLTNTRL